MNSSVSTRQRQRLRKLVCESLESRQLMAADLVQHNFMMPEDSDMSGDVTPLDALVVINRLNVGGVGGPSDMVAALDVDADGSLSPLDALTVINYINRSVGEDEILISQVSIQNRIERLEEAMDSDLLPPNINLAMANQIREILRAGGFPEIGDRMVNGVLNRQIPSSDSSASDTDGNANGELVNGGLDSASDGSSSRDLSDLLGLLEQDSNDTGGDFDFSDRSDLSGVIDPTDDNGNGFFDDSETAAPILNFVEIELRKQLKVSDDAAIGVAVFKNAGEFTSGTWRYVTEEGIGVSGNWSYTTGKPETLNLFRSNVDIEKRIYVQYPGSGFIYYSWLPNEPVGYYFSPIGNAPAFKAYFDSIPGSEMSSIGGFTSYSGDLAKFDGIAPIEAQASALYAIDKASRRN